MAEHQILKRGNFQSYGVAPYNAYTGMWGHYLPQNDKLRADSSMLAFPATFPDGTIFTWDVAPDRDWGGINGYLHVSYGNYDNSPGQITPRQVRAITDLAVAIDWTFEGDKASGLLAECWLAPGAAMYGPFDKTHEIGFLPKLSPSAVAWVNTLPPVGAGSFKDKYGVTWNVREATSGQGTPYYVAYRPGHVEFRGTLHFDDLFGFLVTAKKVTGNEWFNGVAFGVEPQKGAGSLTVDKFAVTYT